MSERQIKELVEHFYRMLNDVPAEELRLIYTDAMRYRWLRTAGAWESEIRQNELSEDPMDFDLAVDIQMESRHNADS